MAGPGCFTATLLLLAACGRSDEAQPRSPAVADGHASVAKAGSSKPGPDQYVIDLRTLCPGGDWTLPDEFNRGRMGRVQGGRFQLRYGCRSEAAAGGSAVDDKLLVAPLSLDVAPSYRSDLRLLEQFDKEGVIERKSGVDESYYERNGDDGNFPAHTGLRETVARDGRRCLDVKLTALTWAPFGEDEREARTPWYSRVRVHMDEGCNIVALYFEQKIVLIKTRTTSRQRVADLLIEHLK